MRLLRTSLSLMVCTGLASGIAAAQPGYDPNPPELILDAPPPDNSIPSVVNDLGGIIGDSGGHELEPGDAVLITPDAQANVNPPLPEESGGGDKPPKEPHARLVTRDGRAIEDPPLPPESGGTPPVPAPVRNPDGSTTYPPGAKVPFSEGISTYNRDGSVTFVPYAHGRADPPPPVPEPPTESPGDSSNAAGGDADAPRIIFREVGGQDAPSSPGSSMTPEQIRNKLKRDEEQMHSLSSRARPRPSADDLRSIREGLESAAGQQAVYIPPVYDHRDPSAVARRDVGVALSGLERERQWNASNRRDAQNRRDGDRRHRSRSAPTRRSREAELEVEGR